MRKISLLFAVMVMSVSAIFAQQEPITKSNYELAERVSIAKVRKMIYSQNVQPMWLESGNAFWYRFTTSEGTKYYFVDAVKGKKRELFNHVEMAARLSEITGDPTESGKINISGVEFDKDEKSFRFSVQSKKEVDKKLSKTEQKKEDEKKAKLEKEGKEYTAPKPKKENKKFYFNYNMATGKMVELNDYESEKRYPAWASVSPKGDIAIYSKNFNLYYMDMANLEKAIEDPKDSTIVEHQITTTGEDGYAYGKDLNNVLDTEVKEFPKKRHPAYIAWSPDGNHFAITRVDSRNIRKLWVINSLAKPRPTLESYRYMMAGEKEAMEMSVEVFDVATKKSKVMDISEYKNQSISMLRKPSKDIKEMERKYKPSFWLGDNNSFVMTRTSRDHKRQSAIRIDINSGKVTQLSNTEMNISLEERAPYMIANGTKFIIRSERDGWAHYYLYGNNGNLINQITKGEYHADKIVNVDEKNGYLYFSAFGVEKGQNPYYEHLCRVKFDGSDFKVLNKGNYFFKSSMNDKATHFVSTYSRVDTAPVNALYNNKGKKILELEKADLSTLFAQGYKFPETFKVKSADGITDLYGVMYKPYDFDSTKVYPIIAYVYPGPQTEAVNESFNASLTRVDQLAQLGFIVITVGNRGGHSVRSKWYHTYGYGNLRDYGLADKKRAIEQLAAKHNFIDISKVGIHGHSGGGFMSTAAMFVYPDFFKVAVSSAGNHDNNIYNRWWSEKHHGVKEIATEKDTTFSYKIATNPELARNLKGKLLLVHGEIDENVHPANTMRVVDALIRAKKRFDMLLLPTQRHGFGDMNEYWFWRTADYFTQHLIGDSERDETHIPQMSE